MSPSDVLVVESGANLNRWLRARGPSAASTVSVIQEQDESPRAFATRVKARIERLCQDGLRIQRVALVGRNDWGLPTLRARLALLRKMRDLGLPHDVRMELHLDDESARGAPPEAHRAPDAATPRLSPAA